jgi:Ca2+-binding RTX toxin-like protein
LHDFKRLYTVLSHTGGAGADSLTGGAGADTFVNSDIDNEGDDQLEDFVDGTDTLQFSAADLNALVGGSNPFSAGDTLGGGPGAFVDFADNGGNVAASGTDGTFIYNDVTGDIIFDADGDSTFTDATDAVGGTTTDDVVVATIVGTAADAVNVGDFEFIA